MTQKATLKGLFRVIDLIVGTTCHPSSTSGGTWWQRLYASIICRQQILQIAQGYSVRKPASNIGDYVPWEGEGSVVTFRIRAVGQDDGEFCDNVWVAWCTRRLSREADGTRAWLEKSNCGIRSTRASQSLVFYWKFNQGLGHALHSLSFPLQVTILGHQCTVDVSLG